MCRDQRTSWCGTVQCAASQTASESPQRLHRHPKPARQGGCGRRLPASGSPAAHRPPVVHGRSPRVSRCNGSARALVPPRVDARCRQPHAEAPEPPPAAPRSRRRPWQRRHRPYPVIGVRIAVPYPRRPPFPGSASLPRLDRRSQGRPGHCCGVAPIVSGKASGPGPPVTVLSCPRHSGEWRNGRRARFRSVCP